MKWLSTVLTLLAVALQSGAVIVPEWVKTSLSDRTLSPIEGVWQIADGAVIAITADDASGSGDYKIVCVDSPDLRITPGTDLGNAHQDGGDGIHYILELYTDIGSSGVLCSRSKFNAEISNGFIELTPQKKFKPNVWLIYRFFFTFSLRSNNVPKTIKGRRIFPDCGPTPDFPVTL